MSLGRRVGCGMLVAFRVMGDDSRAAADVQATFCATLVDEWARLGVRRAMVAPGSRSTPLALALARDERWSVSMFHDERSAAFAALGHSTSSGEPTVVLCTSGTAATHFHAAVVEADLSGTPLIVVTADRPPESLDVGAAQTIRQNGLFGTAVRWSHDPGVPSMSVASSWRSLARRVVGASMGSPAGPVHLNLPFREPLVGTASELPAAYDAPSLLVGDRVLDHGKLDALRGRFSVRRPLLVVGRGTPERVITLAVEHGWPVLAESRTRANGAVVTHFDSLLRDETFAREHVPDLLVRIGEAPASKTLAQWAGRESVEQVHVSLDARVFDPDHRIATRVVTSATDLGNVFAGLPEVVDGSWTSSWREAERRARDVIQSALGELGTTVGVSAVAAFVHALPAKCAIVVSSSMPIRHVEWFAGPLGDRVVVSNRGANGIDGVLATAIGVALHRRGPVGVVLGDVAMLHDSSSLTALASRELDLRILVIDNDGGGIFHYLPQATTVEPEIFETLYGTPHGTDFVALGRAHGLNADVADDIESLRRAAASSGPSLTVVRTDRNEEVEAHRDLHHRVSVALGGTTHR